MTSPEASTIIAVVAAVAWFLIGYFARQPDEAFQPDKVFKTVVAGVITGILIAGLGYSQGDAGNVLNYLTEVGAIAMAEKVWKILLNRFFNGETPKLLGG